MTETYTGPKPQLHAALRALADHLDPWHGMPAWVPSENPEDPWGTGHFATEHVPEQEAARATRIAHAVEHFITGLRAMAEHGDRDAARIWEAMEQERTYAETNAAAGDRMHRTTPSYGSIVHGAMARLEADATRPQDGEVTAWCTECRTRRVVVEVDSSCSTYEGHHELGWTATHLACGHSNQTEPRIIGRSPGGESAAEAIEQRTTQERLARSAASVERWGM